MDEIGFEDAFSAAFRIISSAEESGNVSVSFSKLKNLIEIPSSITELKTLQKIDLSGTKVHDIRILRDMPSLQYIDISNTDVEDISFIGNFRSIVPENENCGEKGVYFENTKIRDQNVQNISRIADVKARTQALVSYYDNERIVEDSDVTDFEALPKLPIPEPGTDFQPNKNYEFEISRREDQIQLTEISSLGGLINITATANQELFSLSQTSNSLSRLRNACTDYEAEINREINEISIDQLWAHGTRIINFQNALAGNSDNFLLEEIAQTDLVNAIKNFHTFHGALINSTARGKTLNRRSFEIFGQFDERAYRNAARKFVDGLPNALMEKIAYNTVQTIQLDLETGSERLSSHSSIVTNSNLVSAMARSLAYACVAGVAGGAAANFVGVDGATPENLRLLIAYMLENEDLLKHLLASSGVDGGWTNAFYQWLRSATQVPFGNQN